MTNELISVYRFGVYRLNVQLAAGRLKIEYHDEDNIKITYPVAKGYETTVQFDVEEFCA